jgi:ABC-type phosphate transport system substrate-binding protein
MRVSLTLPGGRGYRRSLVAVAAVAMTLAVAGLTAPSAHAAFSIPACSGSAIHGEGSSLQKVAQQQFWIPGVFYTSFGCGSGAASSSPVEYLADGSGCGMASLGAGPTSGTCATQAGNLYTVGYRDPNTRFGGSDAPPTPEQKANIEDSGGAHPGVLHVLPVASAAVTVVVHFPEGCELKSPGTGVSSENEDTSTGGPNDPSGAATGDTLAKGTLRVHIPAGKLEQIWDGTPTKWGDIVPAADMTGAPSSAQETGIATECKDVPVRRIVRFDGSGTTYNFKAYLSLLPGAPAGLWLTAPIAGDNNKWPLSSSEKTTPPPVPIVEEGEKKPNVCNAAVSAALICTGSANGGGAVASAVTATDGSIGYLDLATARQKGFDVKAENADHTYWVPLQPVNPSRTPATIGSGYAEPTINPKAHLNGNTEFGLGANCTGADYRGIPTTPASDPTLGDWSNAIATGSLDQSTYPACALTYDMAFDDDAPVYGNTQVEQERARTLKDYLTSVVSSLGQAGLLGFDYGALPTSVTQVAQAGVGAIDWNKSAGSGGGEIVVTPPPPANNNSGGGGGGSQPPSNAFSVAGMKVKGKGIVLSLTLPGSGSVQITAVGGGVKVASVTSSVNGGNGTVTLPISSAALRKVAAAKSKRLAVKITITFTPSGGTAATQVKTITITQASVAARKKHKRHKKKHKKH